MPQIYNMGPTALLPLREACWGFFRPKNPTASAGFEPANLGTKGQHATPRPPKYLWPVRQKNILQRYITTEPFFEKKLLNIKRAFLFSLQLLSETFLILSSERHMIKNVMLVFMESTRYSSQILMKLEFSRQIFETYTNIKLYENPSSRSRVVLCGREDGRAGWRTGRETWRN